ncbi:major facilitator superfamily domain-containing protein 6-like [Latimeria chalumnae]|uniref:major facilitator superfamily domain-containing protein 6-like n=1 Tax=Latimeria chalumnae TaxID=7897 RepID=UPI0003C19BB3
MRNKQWDINKALALTSFFHFVYSAGKSCVIPFLTVHFRQLGLPAVFVGLIMGTKHLISLFWIPSCSYIAKRYGRRRIFILGSLLCSIGAALLLTLIPPINKADTYRYCNLSIHTESDFIKAQVPEENLKSSGHFPINATMYATTPAVGVQTIGENVVLTTSASKPNTTFQHSKYSVVLEMPTLNYSENSTFGRNDSGVQHKTVTVTKKASTTVVLHEDGLDLENGYFVEIKANSSSEHNHNIPLLIDDKIEEIGSGEGYLSGDDVPSSLFKRDVGFLNPEMYHLENITEHTRKPKDVSLDLLKSLSLLDKEYQVFFLVLMVVVLWELVSAPLEQTADDGLYEYLDFIDATDRYRRHWNWGHVGAAAGACSIGILVDRLNCFLNIGTSRSAVHFYGYAVLITLTLLVGAFYPIHYAKKGERGNRAFKALSLIISDGRTITSAFTVFLTGAVGSTVHNFLFWQMQDKGSGVFYMGASVAVGLLAEVLLYFFKDKLLRTISYTGTIGLGLLCLAVQLLYYSYLWSSWSVLPAQLLNAFSNGALWWAVCAQSNDVATPGMERHLHRTFHGLSYGFGAGVGSIASGFIVKKFGLVVLFRACSAALVLWSAVFLMVQFKLPRQKRLNYSRLLAADASDLSDSEDEQERDWLVKAMKEEKVSAYW